MRLIHDHILRKINDEMVLMPLSQEETDFHGMLVLNNTGAYICQLLQQEISKDTLIVQLSEKYHLEVDKLTDDVEEFLRTLGSCHMLIP